MEQDGVVIANAFITPQTLVAIGAEIAEGAKIVEQIQYNKQDPIIWGCQNILQFYLNQSQKRWRFS